MVEGTRWLLDLSRASATPALILYTDEWVQASGHAELLARFPAPVQLVSDQVMAAASDTESPQGVLAVVPMPPALWPEAPSLLLILDEINNPGNLGTLIRTSAAAGVEGVLLGPGCVDAYNPKVIRGGMGAHLRLPICPTSWQELPRICSGMAIWLAAADGEADYTSIDWCRPSALIIGNEARGASHAAYRLATGRVSIPIASNTESLNAAVAASVILFEAARQRRASRHV